MVQPMPDEELRSNAFQWLSGAAGLLALGGPFKSLEAKFALQDEGAHRVWSMTLLLGPGSTPAARIYVAPADACQVLKDARGGFSGFDFLEPYASKLAGMAFMRSMETK